jgi:DNA-binding transcriptional regulator YhcF (GntR family)
VAEAYRTLEEEGWLEIGRRSGAKVISRAAPGRHGPAVEEAFRRRLREMAAEAQARGLSRRRIAGELRRCADDLERS